MSGGIDAMVNKCGGQLNPPLSCEGVGSGGGMVRVMAGGSKQGMVRQLFDQAQEDLTFVDLSRATRRNDFDHLAKSDHGAWRDKETHLHSCFYGWLDQTGTWSPLVRLSTLENHQPIKARRPDMVKLKRESNGTGVFIPRRSINPKRGSNYGGVHDQGSLCKHVVKS
ncbi:hypothetical protein QJS10_CPA03g02055 [Acorus calamus]|uniref:Uncharacterized protein n=1 Tax=Acorus calamus TaxID=4465 RepID=A0AAV9F9U8_ACOCL|nr:hypothetical protein QJS10_CPA03g02055 [Acorus calamus]